MAKFLLLTVWVRVIINFLQIQTDFEVGILKLNLCEFVDFVSIGHGSLPLL